MTRKASALLAASALVGLGASVFLFGPSDATTFSGTPFGGAGQSGSGGSSSQSTFTSTQTDGGPGFCFGGSCAVSFASDGGVVTLNGAELNATLANSQNVNANTIITPYAVVSQAASGERAFGPAHDGARVYFGESGNVYAYNNAGQIVFAASIEAGSMETDTLGSATGGRDRVEIFYPQPYPLGSLSTCDAAHMGVLKTLSSDGRTYQCNGTSNQTFGFRAAWSSALDFGAFAGASCETLTFAASGAVANEPIAAGGCGTILAGDADLECFVNVSATNTVQVRVCCRDAGDGCGDPASTTFTAAASR